MENKKYTANFAINLADKHRTERNIGYNWEITIKPRKKKMLQRIFSTGDDVINKGVKLSIDNLVYPKQLYVNGPLFTLCKGSELIDQHDLPYSVTLNSFSTSFSVFINEQNIKDYQEPFELTATVITISFDLICVDDLGVEIDKTHVELNVELTKIECEPKLELMLEEEVQYDSQLKEYYIGDLIVESTADLDYPAPVLIRGRIDANLDDVPNKDLIIIKKDDTIVEDVYIKNLHRNERFIYSIFLEMGKMKNPINDRARIEVCFSGYYRVGASIDNKHLDTAPESVDILQDAQGTELVVHMDTKDGKRVENNSVEKRDLYNFYALSNTLNEMKIYLGNLAKDTSRRKAGLKIMNLGLAQDIDSNVKLYDSEGQLIDINKSDIFRLECSYPKIKEEGIFIPNGEMPPVELLLLFSAANLSSIKGSPDFLFTLVAKISFDYYENRFGDDDFTKLERKTFTMSIKQPLYLQPNPQWLCVDYGSSAIVCLYDNELINLRDRKRDIMTRAIKEERFRLDTFENGSKFLSSDIVLHTIREDSTISSFATEHEGYNPENYNDLAVFLSPTSSLFTAESLRQLPCLKLLVGNTWLPKNKYLEDYKYNRRINETVTSVIARDDKKSEKSLLRVDQVFLQSYEALFRYYISSVVPNRDTINRLVLTYPNTYTPRHRKTLRELIGSAFPEVRIHEFVSESDAVAAYYLKHWNDYAEQDGEYSGNEKILVYDMGAGTLDISYIDKHCDEEGNLIMDILAKFGTTMAGNYLDFVLAQIVADLCDLESNIATTRAAIDEETSHQRTKLKLFVKNELKLRLKTASREKLVKYNKVAFNIGQVLDHPLLEEYLNASSTQILTQLSNYMEIGSGQLIIDTVLLSGRSCLFEPLQMKLRANINEVTINAPRFVVLDAPNRNIDGNNERQKTAVAEGAMEIANNYRRQNSMIHVRSRRHYASFGLAYEVTGGNKVYRELLNHSKIPNANSLENFVTEEISIDKLNNVSQLILIQTYLSASDTEIALNKGDYRFVSEMEIIDTQTLGMPSSVNAKLCINNLNDIIVYFGTQRTPGRQPNGEDLQSEETKRSIWPFTV